MRSALTSKDWEIEATCGKCKVPFFLNKGDIHYGMVMIPGDDPEERFYWNHCGQKNVLSNVPPHLQQAVHDRKNENIGPYDID